MSSKRIIGLVLCSALLAAGCGGGAAGSTSTTRSASASSTGTGTSTSAGTGASASTGTPPAAFAWLHPAPSPAGWSTARLIGTTSLAYPSSWRQIHSDPGTVSAALTQPGTGLVSEYLNATPQQGGETLQDWARFRPDHNEDEGDRHEQVLASAKGLKFRNGTGSCVIDRYRTSRTSYQEIACLVRGSRGGSVIVAAALAGQWAHDAPTLERSVSAFMA